MKKKTSIQIYCKGILSPLRKLRGSRLSITLFATPLCDFNWIYYRNCIEGWIIFLQQQSLRVIIIIYCVLLKPYYFVLEFLEKELYDYVAKLPVSTRVIRSSKRIGLIKARLMGARQAKGKILVFLDAHCECTLGKHWPPPLNIVHRAHNTFSPGWLEALVSRVAEDRKRVVCPVIDIISDETFAYVRSFDLYWGAFNWDLHFRWYTRTTPDIIRGKRDTTQAFKTPAMAGGLFAMDKSYFFELGGYDERMEIWGGENLELSFRVGTENPKSNWNIRGWCKF